MPMTPDQKAMTDAILEGFDRLAYKLYGGIARVFGGLAGKNEEPYAFGFNGVASSGSGSVGGGDGFVNLQNVVNAVNTGSFRVTQEADFVAARLHVITVATASGVILPPQSATGPSFLVQIKQGGSDRTFFNVPLHIETVAGNAERSYPFAKNLLIRRNSTITANFTNLQTVATQVYLALVGFKIYDSSSLNLIDKR